MKSILALSISLIFLSTSRLVAEEMVIPSQTSQTPAAAETIVDINLEFLMGNPKTAWGNDLFKKKPGFAEFVPAEEKFTLQGIAFDKSGSSAVIDGKIAHLGDTLGERKITEIGPNYVVLEKGDSQVQLVLPLSTRRKSP